MSTAGPTERRALTREEKQKILDEVNAPVEGLDEPAEIEAGGDTRRFSWLLGAELLASLAYVALGIAINLAAGPAPMWALLLLVALLAVMVRAVARLAARDARAGGR